MSCSVYVRFILFGVRFLHVALQKALGPGLRRGDAVLFQFGGDAALFEFGGDAALFEFGGDAVLF